MSVRVNGVVLWRYDTGLQSAWKYGAVDLSPWSGQSALVELISDSQGLNYADWNGWAELAIDSSPAGTGSTNLSATGPITAPATGISASIAITAPGDAPWMASGSADWVSATPASGSGNGSTTYTVSPNFGPARSTTLVVAGHLLSIRQNGGQPTITAQPQSAAAAPGNSVTLGTTASANVGNALQYQWLVNGSTVVGATSATLNLANLQPANAGIYTTQISDPGAGLATSDAAIVGVTTTSKVVGAGTEIANGVFVASNGNTFDQVLPSGAALTVTAEPGKITRTSFVDLTNDIVQVEFAGAGSLSLVLDNPSGPALATNYNQPATSYMKGHVGIVITGANETTNVSVFSVGRITAVNQALFRSDVTYDGLADLSFIAISSTNGKFGGLRASNGSFYATKGLTGVYAPGVQFQGPVFIGDISAFGAATPAFIIGSSPDTRVTGGDLLQPNGRGLQVSGLTQLKFTAGSTSHGMALPAQNIKGALLQNGTDVTAQIAVNPSP